MKVVSFRTLVDDAAPAGEQVVHLAQLACGHIERIDVTEMPTQLRCPEGCDDAAYTCPRCGAVSHHPKDVQERYCGACHQFEVP
jgi:hypothetical protein